MLCKYSKYCGGCENLNEDITCQLDKKTQYIKDLFKNYPNAQIDNTIGLYPYKYRNKIHLAFTELKGKTLIGFYEENSERVVDIDKCLLFGDWANKLIEVIKEYISRFKIRPYSKLYNTGTIRYVHARCIDNKLQITLVVANENFGGKDWLYNKLTTMFNEVSLYVNINKRTDHAIFGNVFKFIKGNKYLEFTMCGVKVLLSPNSFLQVNLDIAEKMYKQAEKLLDINTNSTIVDMYSGIGITSIMFSKSAQNVLAIEETPSSVDNCKLMLKLNNTKNVKVFEGKCENMCDKIIKNDNMSVFVDPARVGLDTKVINKIIDLSPKTIVYMSCNPESCLRDVNMLTKSGQYNLISITPYNMFPYTKHVEILANLQRIN